MQISEGASVQAGGSGPVDKKPWRSPQHWVHAIGYPNSRGPQAGPSPMWDKTTSTAYLLACLSVLEEGSLLSCAL